MASQVELASPGGVAIVNPIPVPDEIPAEEIGVIIDQALTEMDAQGIHGKEATPFLLGRIVEITQGASLTANIALVATTIATWVPNPHANTPPSNTEASPLKDIRIQSQRRHTWQIR